MTHEKLAEYVKEMARQFNELEKKVEALEGNCDCEIDLDGSTIRGCALHPQGGSPKGMKILIALSKESPLHGE
jgi:hypothetical protein